MSKSKKSAQDNRANQLNPKHPSFHRSRGAKPDEAQRLAGLPKPARTATGNESKAPPQSSNGNAGKPE